MSGSQAGSRKASDKLRALEDAATAFAKRWSLKRELAHVETEEPAAPVPPGGAPGSPQASAPPAPPTLPRGAEGYPWSFLDLIMFHKLHLSMSAEKAVKGFRALKESFVDWNEVRISSVREIQEALAFCPGSLDLAVFVKDILEVLHRERQDVSLEFLAEMNLGEIRQFLKQFKRLDPSTAEVILRVRKGYPVLPIAPAVETVLERLGVLRKGETRAKMEKDLAAQISPEKTLLVHHFLLNHSFELCPPEEEAVACSSCSLRPLCAFYARAGKRAPRGGRSPARSPAAKRRPTAPRKPAR